MSIAAGPLPLVPFTAPSNWRRSLTLSDSHGSSIEVVWRYAVVYGFDGSLMSNARTPTFVLAIPGFAVGCAVPWYPQAFLFLPLPSRHSVVCQLAPSPRTWASSCRLQLKPWKPPGCMRSAIGTWPCNPVSGLSPGPHTALGTVPKNSSSSARGDCLFSTALSPAPPIDDRATQDSATTSDVACLMYVPRFLMLTPPCKTIR